MPIATRGLGVFGTEDGSGTVGAAEYVAVAVKLVAIAREARRADFPTERTPK